MLRHFRIADWPKAARTPVTHRRANRRRGLERLEPREMLAGEVGEIAQVAWNGKPVGTVRDQWLVGLAAATDLDQARTSALAAFGNNATLEPLKTSGNVALLFAPAATVDQVLAWDVDQAAVTYAEPNFTASIQALPNDAVFAPEATADGMWAFKNDGQPQVEWNGAAFVPGAAAGTFDADIDATVAWNSHTGTHRTAVGVVDTGIDYAHEDLYLNIWINQREIPPAIAAALIDTDGDGLTTFIDLNDLANAASVVDADTNGRIDASDLLTDANWENAIDEDANGLIDDLVGWDFINNDNDPTDDHFHGTHVAGTIGAIGNNAVGVTGVNWQVQLAAIKSLDVNGVGSIATLVDGLNYATAIRRAGGSRLIAANSSWGLATFSQTLAHAVAAAEQAEVLVIASAGDTGTDNDVAPNYPSSFPNANVIAVAASGSTDNFPAFSSFGESSVHLAAPGVNILSTVPTTVTPAMTAATLTARYGSQTGTSMAAAHVSGAAALLASSNPATSAAQIRASILANVDVRNSFAARVITSGRLNLADSANAAPQGGPQVTALQITAAPAYQLISSPSAAGPTPAIASLTVRIRDLPIRSAIFNQPALDAASAAALGNYRLEGDSSGVVPITAVTVTNDPVVAGQPATASVVLQFARPLPDDRFTLTVADTLADTAGNRLDGESNAAAPIALPTFPSGDGVPGGNFVARFTVDARPEIAVHGAGTVFIDTNGNGRFDPTNADQANRDIVHRFGFTSDDLVVGNFGTTARPADGFDRLAAYGRVGSQWRWLIDIDNDGAVIPVANGGNDVVAAEATINATPVAGNFDGIAANGDEVGLFDGMTWHFDTIADNIYKVNTNYTTPLRGFPIVGDFNGDTFVDLGTWQQGTFSLLLSNGANQIPLAFAGINPITFRFDFPGIAERPVAADMNGDGFDDIGLWVPQQLGSPPSTTGQWFFLVSNGGSVPSRIIADPDNAAVNTIPFRPAPFGQDIFMQFGDSFAIPLVGNFDPPIAPPTTTPAPTTAPTSNDQPRTDTTAGRTTTPTRTARATDEAIVRMQVATVRATRARATHTSTGGILRAARRTRIDVTLG